MSLIEACIEDMLDTTPTDGDVFRVLGRASMDDGGGGDFCYDSSMDKADAEGGVFFDLGEDLDSQGTGTGTGCLVRLTNEEDYVSVLWFGAVADGTKIDGTTSGTDNTDAFQAAIDYATTIGKVLRIPAGVYKIASGLTLPVQAGGITIIGEGNTAPAKMSVGSPDYFGSTILFTHATDNLFTADGGEWYNTRAIRILDLGIDSIVSTGWAISLTGAPDRTVCKNISMLSQKGILYNDMWTNCTIEDCHVDAQDNTISGSIGFHFRNETLIGGLDSIINCTAKYLETGIKVGRGVSTDKRNYTTSLLVTQIIHCKTGLKTAGADILTVDGCHFESNTVKTIDVTYGAIGLKITGSYFQSNTTGVAIDLNAANNNTKVVGLEIKSCIFVMDTGEDIIDLGNTDYVDGEISGCRFTGTASMYGIYSDSGTPQRVKLSNNSFAMISEANNTYAGSGKYFGEVLEYDVTNDLSTKTLGPEVLTKTLGPQAVQFVSVAAAYAQTIPDGASHILLTGGPQSVAYLSPTRSGTSRQMLEGEKITLMVDTAGGSFMHNNTANYNNYRFLNKSGANVTTTYVGQTMSYVLKVFNSVPDWYEV